MPTESGDVTVNSQSEAGHRKIWGPVASALSQMGDRGSTSNITTPSNRGGGVRRVPYSRFPGLSIDIKVGDELMRMFLRTPNRRTNHKRRFSDSRFNKDGLVTGGWDQALDALF